MAKRTIDEWEDTTLSPLKERFGERRDSFETASGIPINTIILSEPRRGPMNLRMNTRENTLLHAAFNQICTEVAFGP